MAYATTLSPQQAAQQQQLQALTGGLLGGMGGGSTRCIRYSTAGSRRRRRLPNRGYGSYGHREADVYERIRAVHVPVKNNVTVLALQEQSSLSQGRTGFLRTAQFGGSPEQFALAQAQGRKLKRLEHL